MKGITNKQFKEEIVQFMYCLIHYEKLIKLNYFLIFSWAGIIFVFGWLIMRILAISVSS